MTYTQLKKTMQDRVNNFDGLFFAFSTEQLNAGLKKFNTDTKGIVSIGSGGFLLKERAKAFHTLITQNEKDLKEFKKNEKQLVKALVFELGNHEYCINEDLTSALDSLGFTFETVPKTVLKKALREYWKDQENLNEKEK